MNINLSIIIPVYNAYSFLKDILYLIQNENHRDYQYIFIDDGSTDKSNILLESTCRTYDNCSVITTKNNGYGKACNIGIEKATGTYIAIFEPDDILSENFYDDLISKADSKKLDIVKYNGLYTYHSYSVDKREHYISQDYCNRVITDRDIIMPLWKNHSSVFNGIYNREWINRNNIRFVETPGASFQDLQFNISLYYSSPRIYIIDSTKYYYRQHENQSVKNADQKIPLVKDAWELQRTWLTNQGITDISFFLYLTYLQTYTLYTRRINARRNKKNILKEYKRLIRRIKKSDQSYSLKRFSRVEKKLHKAIVIHPFVFILLNSIIKLLRKSKQILFVDSWVTIKRIAKLKFKRFIDKYIKIYHRLHFIDVKKFESTSDLVYENNARSNTIEIQYNMKIWSELISKARYPLIRLADMNTFSVFFKSGRLVSTFSDEYESRLNEADLFLFWGQFRDAKAMEMLKEAKIRNMPFLFLEDGFIRSITPTPDKRYSKFYKQSLSLTADKLSNAFDITRPSMFENMLNSERVLTDEELSLSKRLISKIIENHLTKYNHQPIYSPQIGRESKPKILVIDQAYNDWSIKKGAASSNTFLEMLECAKQENPDSDIIIKIHPDMLSDKLRGGGNTLGYYGNIEAKDNIILYAETINPISMIKYVDKVYTCSSQMGFEALMCGKETVIFGAPFYAGWGVGDIRNTSYHLHRRKKRRSVVEIFYFMYIEYTHYINPHIMRECDLEEFIDVMVEERDRFFNKYNIRFDR